MGTKYREGDVEWEVPDELCPPTPTWAAFKAHHQKLLTEQRQARPAQDGSAPADDGPASREKPRADG